MSMLLRGSGEVVDRFIGPQCFLGPADPGIEVIVSEQRIREIVPGEPMGYAEAVRRALADDHS